MSIVRTRSISRSRGLEVAGVKAVEKYAGAGAEIGEVGRGPGVGAG